jgi:hypothetical protein
MFCFDTSMSKIFIFLEPWTLLHLRKRLRNLNDGRSLWVNMVWIFLILFLHKPFAFMYYGTSPFQLWTHWTWSDEMFFPQVVMGCRRACSWAQLMCPASDSHDKWNWSAVQKVEPADVGPTNRETLNSPSSSVRRLFFLSSCTCFSALHGWFCTVGPGQIDPHIGIMAKRSKPI